MEPFGKAVIPKKAAMIAARAASIDRNGAMDDAQRPSKTQRKKQMHELQALGERLLALNPDQLAAVELPEDLREAVNDARRLRTHEARRRQMQYIGRLMRGTDPAAIIEKLAIWNGQSREHAAREREIARLRERLIEDDCALTELARRHARVDTQRLRVLVRNARAERDAGRPPKNYRELFRALREALAAAGAAGEGE